MRRVDPIAVALFVVASATPVRLHAQTTHSLTGESSHRITLAASNADARTLLLAIAREAGIELVVTPDVRARVSVEFTNVPAIDALNAVIARVGLSVIGPPPTAKTPSVVFYQLPVDVNAVTPEVIAARFGVSLEMASWIAQNQTKDMPPP
jgi:hypothetical protein